MTRKCSQCGREFTLTDSEIAFYNKKGLHLPKRCKDCRAANKAASSEHQSNDNSASTQKKTASRAKIKPVRIILALTLLVAVFFFGDGLLGGEEDITPDNSPSFQTNIPGGLDDGDYVSDEGTSFKFRNSELLEQHYQKHGIEMGFASAEAYEAAASAVANDENALHKTEKEDSDDVYYIEDTNEFVVVSSDGYLRTYFYPSAGKDYFDRQ